MSVRRLLLISYEFPPAGGITVQRALNFTKYLPKNGIEVHVLSAANPATPIIDPDLLRHVPAEVRLHRAFTPELPFKLRKRLWDAIGGSKPAASQPKTQPEPAPPGMRSKVADAIRGYLFPDPHVVWRSFALRKASSVIRRYGIDTVMVTAPPFSVFLIGSELKRRFPEVRLVVDFRDEWLRFLLTDFDFFNSPQTRARAERIERETIERADLVLAVTESSIREIRSRYPDQPDRKFAVLHNGFDPEVLGAPELRSHGLDRKMVVTHVGTVYKTASPRFYLDAVDTLPEEIRSRIVTRFIGRLAETEKEIFAGRKSEIACLGFMPQAQAVRHLAETDYLLLTMTNDFSLPGKLFEYLASGRPVLALSPAGGEVDRFLQKTTGGWCAPHNDPGAIRDLLLRAWERTCAGERTWPTNWDVVRGYERPRLARRLAALLAERLG